MMTGVEASSPEPLVSDPSVLGDRIRRLRQRRGLTQAGVAGADLSVAYISRIESGQRRPERATLELIASRLGTTVEHLLTGVGRDEAEDLRLSIRYADLALHSGDVDEAERRFRDVLSSLGDRRLEDIADQAAWGHARALEAMGRLKDAAATFDHLRERTKNAQLRLQATVAVCRCYREAGDLVRAVEVGEDARARLIDLGLLGTTDGIKLVVTLAAAYYERGDLTRALILVEDALRDAEALNSPAARAAAYWNASSLLSESDQLPEALTLAERALALLSEGEDERNLARLRVEYGGLLLRGASPAPDRALEVLTRAEVDLEQGDGTPVDRMYCHEMLGRALLQLGQLDAAEEHAAAALRLLGDEPRLETASIFALRGQAALAADDSRSAKRHYRHAAALLTAAGAGRAASGLWAELGAALETLGDTAGSRDAYRAGMACLGIVAAPAPTVSRPVRVAARSSNT
jgi:transcriptional regulator with XRE-family HTH domain